MEEDLLLPPLSISECFQEDTQKHDRVLKPFAFVDSDQPDAFHSRPGAVWLFLGRFHPWIHMLCQPLEQAADAKAPFCFGLMQHLGPGEAVGKPPFPVRKGQQTAGGILLAANQCRNMRRSRVRPTGRVFVEPLANIPATGFRCRPESCAPSHAEKVGGSAPSTRRLVPRQRHASQDAAELDHLRKVVNGGRSGCSNCSKASCILRACDSP